jgi:hypothetical protein
VSLVELVPIVVALVIAGTALWVYSDAKTRAVQGDPVITSVGLTQLDSPEIWAVVCLVLWVFAFPLYLRSRKRPS